MKHCIAGGDISIWMELDISCDGNHTAYNFADPIRVWNAYFFDSYRNLYCRKIYPQVVDWEFSGRLEIGYSLCKFDGICFT